MDVHDLNLLADQHLAKARASRAARSATTVTFDGALRQTLVALAKDTELAEHESPPAATLQVLRGDVRLKWADQGQDLATGQLAPIPPARHSLLALTDAVVLLTVRAD